MQENFMEETAKLLRKENIICQKCNYFDNGKCIKPIFDSCDNDENILSICEILNENGYMTKETILTILKDLKFLYSERAREYTNWDNNTVKAVTLDWLIADINEFIEQFSNSEE